MRTPLVIFFLVFSVVLHAGIDDGWFDPAFLEANSIAGATGFINVPTSEVLPAGDFSAAIHLYQVDVGYGLWDAFEIGFTTNLGGFSALSPLETTSQLQILYENELFYARLRLLSLEKQGFGLSVGAGGLGWQDFGFSSLGYTTPPSVAALETFYAVAEAAVPGLPSALLTGGWESGDMPVHGFVNLSKVIFPGFLAMGEYDGFGTNFGIRLLLSPRIKLDLAFVNTQSVDWSQPFSDVLHQNVNFGVTYSEPWNSGLAFLKSSL